MVGATKFTGIVGVVVKGFIDLETVCICLYARFLVCQKQPSWSYKGSWACKGSVEGLAGLRASILRCR